MNVKSISNLIFLSAAAVCTALFAGCIKNDIPYPYIQANFLTINAAGQSQESQIDSINRRVTLYFPETVDIYNISISDYTLTPGAKLVGDVFSNPVDLSSPVDVTLSLYQDYNWTIIGNYNISRYFTLANQVGSSVIDVPGRRVVAYISDKSDIKSVLVESIKLGPEGSVIEPDIEGKRIDFSDAVKLNVSCFGRTESWTLYVATTESSVSTVRADAWTQVAWIYGEAETGRDNGVEYRLKGDSEWTRAPKDWLTTDGGSFHARLIHLSPMTTYEARAYSDTEYGETLEFTTGSILQVPNASLDSWWLDGKIWDPWPQGGEQWWDTGNKGATTIGQSNSVPTDDTSSGQGQAAKLETVFAGIGSIGKLAAGNLFAGRYVRTDGTNGILSFGRPFVERPTRLTGYLKYKTAPINNVTEGFSSLIGEPDTCIVWCSLIDSAEPFEIRTNPRNRQLFDENGPEVIAYGKIEFGENVDNYIPFSFDIVYKSTSRVPRYILITASASKYGDYFTGGVGATLYLDDLELVYDY